MTDDCVTASLPELTEALNAVTVKSEGAFLIAGEELSVKSFQQAGLLGYPPPDCPIVAALTLGIYTRLFAVMKMPVLNDAYRRKEDLTPVLQSSNWGRTEVLHGWFIEEIFSNSSLFARRSGIGRVLGPGEYVVVSPTDMRLAIGQEVAAVFPHEFVGLQPGFYHAVSYANEDASDQIRMVRFYWNVTAEGAASLVKQITERFRKMGLPYRFKVVNLVPTFERRDSAVLMVPQRYFQASMPLVMNIASELRPYMEPEVPMLTRRIGTGIGFAEDPGTGESFGFSVSKLLAEVVWEAFSEGRSDLGTRMKILRKKFEKRHANAERLYLARSTFDIYDFDTAN